MPRNERGKEFEKTYQVDEKQNSMDFLEIRLVSIIKDMPDGEVIEFEELFEIVTKDYVVVTFLSILDLAKKQELEIKQENNFSKIILSLKGCD